MAALYEPITIGNLEIPNRLWLSPMCMYVADGYDGVATDWHFVHYSQRAMGGFGLIMTESTAVSPEGRITPWDLGLWSDEQVISARRITDFVHSVGGFIGVQLGHSGLKGSDTRFFPNDDHAADVMRLHGWKPVGPRSEALDGHPEATALDSAGIRKVIQDFKDAALRAQRAGFDVVEIHGGHGYLLHQFFSPLTNSRTDAYGGSFDNRIRLVTEVTQAIREVWSGPLMIRLSATDWLPGGWTCDECIELAAVLKKHGIDFIDATTGGLLPADIPVGPGYQVRFAEAIRRNVQIPTSAVGLITDAKQAETIVASGQADAVMIGRQALREPSFPLRAAAELGVPQEKIPYQPSYRGGAW